MFIRSISTLPIVLLLSFSLGSSGCVGDGERSSRRGLPETTHDGLERVRGTRFRAVFKKPDADLGGYDRIMLLDCAVAFRRNWQRDQNRSASGPGRRVRDRDVQRIRENLSQHCNRVFREEFVERGGVEIVEEPGSGVLLIRPAIIDLDVTAPARGSSGRSTTFVASAGQMTLFMELFDSVTGSILVRVLDRRAGDNMGAFELASSVSNSAAANRILRRWARILRERLDEIREQYSAPANVEKEEGTE